MNHAVLGRTPTNRMLPADAMMWRLGQDSRTRSNVVITYLLDRTPDWETLRAAHHNVSKHVRRARQSVRPPRNPWASPTWCDIRSFSVDQHLHRVTLAPGSGMEGVLELCRRAQAKQWDPNRPLWEASLVEGFDNDRAAYILCFHHCLTDAQGLSGLTSEMMKKTAPSPRPSKRLSNSSLPRRVIAPIKGALLFPPYLFAARSVLWRTRSTERQLITLDVPLDWLKSAGRAAGGTINDTFLAAVLAAMSRYHEHFGAPLKRVPTAFPVAVAPSGPAQPGNQFRGLYFVVPDSETDPLKRIGRVNRIVQRSTETKHLTRAMAWRLVSPVVVPITLRCMAQSDFLTSNVKGPSRPFDMFDARVEAIYGFAPLVGSAVMLCLTSYQGMCHIAITLDPAAIRDVAYFRTCLDEAVSELRDVVSPQTDSGMR